MGMRFRCFLISSTDLQVISCKIKTSFLKPQPSFSRNSFGKGHNLYQSSMNLQKKEVLKCDG